jgi:hypothetical protein
MPFKIEAGQFCRLVGSFLHVVLAESALPGSRRLAQAGSGPGLGNGQQLHRICRSPGGDAGSRNACTHSLQVGGD